MESSPPNNKTNPSTPAVTHGSDNNGYRSADVNAASASVAPTIDTHRNGYMNGDSQRATSVGYGAPQGQSSDSVLNRHRNQQLPPLQRGHSTLSHPLSSPRTIYSATPGHDAGLFPRISSSPHPTQAVPAGPITPSPHFPLAPALPSPSQWYLHPTNSSLRRLQNRSRPSAVELAG